MEKNKKVSFLTGGLTNVFNTLPIILRVYIYLYK